MSIEPNLTRIGDFVVRERFPDGPDPYKVLLLLHGWTGDENSMWIFTPRLPRNYLILAPRGITKTPLGGYGWQDEKANAWPTAVDFQQAIGDLLKLVDSIEYSGIDTSNFDVMGFSQGAALAYSLALTYPDRIGKLAGLSGFLPDGLDSEIAQEALRGKHVFVAHGLRDEMVPLSKAREAVQGLKDAKAEVLYCEDNVGHKLSSGCFRGLGDYFNRN
jgi:phospholipase/carboxylesterase